MTDQAPALLQGLRVLIVEDEYYLADDLTVELRRQGAVVIGPVGTIEEAREQVEQTAFDCAILDMNLRGDMAFPVADRLQEAGIPYVIATGYNSVSMPERFKDVTRVEKPFDPGQVVAAIPLAMSNASPK